MKNSKYIKVSVSDRLPETAGYYFIINRAASIQIGYFMWQVGKHSEMLTVWDQHKLFQKLYEWHFDVYGLLSRGLAINKH